MKNLLKYLKYLVECIKIKNTDLILISIRYFLLKKMPGKDILINNPKMGIFHCRANTTDFMYSFLSYEHDIKSLIMSYLDDFDIFIDMGACIGDYSIWMAKNNLKSYAFEPIIENYQTLTENVELNQLENRVMAYNIGLGSKNETVTFAIHPHNKGASGKYLEIDDSNKQTVDVKKFDDFVKEQNFNLKQNYIVKIDAEGMELEIIKGAKEFFSNAQKVLLIFEATHTKKEEIINLIRENLTIQVLDIDYLNAGILINNTDKY